MIFSAISSVIGAVAGGIGKLGASLSGIAGLAGTAASVAGSMIQQKGMKKAEILRMRQMNLQATRERRQTLREAIVARSQALSQATAQGAENSSGLQGGLSQVTGQAASNIQGISQGQEIGAGMFSANKMISTGQTMASIGSGLMSFSTFLSESREQSRRVWDR